MYRTRVCTMCDNNRVNIEKVGHQYNIKCSNCGDILMQGVYLQSWDRNIDSIYKLGIEDDKFIELDLIESDSTKEEAKIRLIYKKEYELIRKSGKADYEKISNSYLLEDYKIKKCYELEYKAIEKMENEIEYEREL